jgi:hypothetical protein
VYPVLPAQVASGEIFKVGTEEAIVEDRALNVDRVVDELDISVGLEAELILVELELDKVFVELELEKICAELELESEFILLEAVVLGTVTDVVWVEEANTVTVVVGSPTTKLLAAMVGFSPVPPVNAS